MVSDNVLCWQNEGRRTRHLVTVFWLLLLAGNMNRTVTGKLLKQEAMLMMVMMITMTIIILRTIMRQ